MNKNIGIENSTKMESTIIQGIVKTEMEVVEAENSLLFPHRYSLHYAMTVECTIPK